MMYSIKLFFLALSFWAFFYIGSANAKVNLDSFFGEYRARAYNGVENIYSEKFFLPSINQEPSVKIKKASGENMQTMNFNFEVPLEKAPDTIYLKFLFLEFPLDGASGTEFSDSGLSLEYKGVNQENALLVDGSRYWVSCSVHYSLTLTPQFGTRYLKISFLKEAIPPCEGQKSEILAERVLFN